MDVIYGQNNNKINEPTGVGLGNFDGLHIGHMALINTLIEESKFVGLKSLIYTFTKHPEHILRKKLFKPLLVTPNKKIELLSKTDLNYLYFDEFDEVFSRMKPEDFVKNILFDKLNIKLAICGFNYKFGFKGLGNISLLKDMGEKLKFRVYVLPPVKVGSDIVSSTRIRNVISEGKLDEVFSLLARHYSIRGEVIHGSHIGQTIGFPTANFYLEDYLLLPSIGVYASKTLFNKKLYDSITNVGNNPTFGNTNNISIETHILDFNGDLYGKNIEIFFISKIRDEKKFDSKEDLIEQIKKDIVMVRHN